MDLQIETDRLILKVLTPDFAPATLAFYKDNAEIFEKYEPIVGDNFYTLEHHRHMLTHEYRETLQLRMVRFWIFEKSDPDTIIGTVSFHNISSDIFASTTVGYKMIPSVWRKGYCYEALIASITLLFNDVGIRRFEALVLPDNVASISLLEKVGFLREGLLKRKVYIQNQWRDHYLYGLILE